MYPAGPRDQLVSLELRMALAYLIPSKTPTGGIEDTRESDAYIGVLPDTGRYAA